MYTLDCDSRCAKGVAAAAGGRQISAPVGLGGANRPPDVVTVQELLNAVPPARGGPVPLLAVDGIAGPKTNAAIGRFQKQQLGFSDARVDPGRQTLAALNREAGQGQGAGRSSLSGAEARRLQTAISTTPDALAAVDKAIKLVERAQAYAAVGPGGLFVTPEAYDFVARHFAMQDMSLDAAMASLRFMHTIYFRMRQVVAGRPDKTTGGLMWGTNLHDIDPDPSAHDPRAKAIMPNTDHDGMVTSRIYWSPGIDGEPRDRFIYILIHELAHFVDEDDPSLEVVDKGYAFFGTVARLSHRERLHNADNYSMMAFDHAFGRQRLVALYPLLASWPK